MEICTEDGVTLVVEVVEDLGVGVDGMVNGQSFIFIEKIKDI